MKTVSIERPKPPTSEQKQITELRTENAHLRGVMVELHRLISTGKADDLQAAKDVLGGEAYRGTQWMRDTYAVAEANRLRSALESLQKSLQLHMQREVPSKEHLAAHEDSVYVALATNYLTKE